MKRTAALVTLALVSTVVWVPLGSAHPFGQPITGPSGHRCYYYDEHETDTRQFWIETNNVLTGGEKLAWEWFGVPGTGSGLQRVATVVDGQTVDADTEVSLNFWLAFCTE